MKGFIALTTVLVILAISLILGLSISRLSINEAIFGLNKTFSSRAYYLANLCAEEGLIRLKENPGYSGKETIPIEEGSCEINIEGRQVMATGNYRDQVKKIKITVSAINLKMIISSWEEVGDF